MDNSWSNFYDKSIKSFKEREENKWSNINKKDYQNSDSIAVDLKDFRFIKPFNLSEKMKTTQASKTARNLINFETFSKDSIRRDDSFSNSFSKVDYSDKSYSKARTLNSIKKNEEHYLNKSFSVKPHKEKSRPQKSKPVLPENKRRFNSPSFTTDATLANKNMKGEASGSTNTGNYLFGFKSFDSSIKDLSNDLRYINKNGNNLGVENSKFVQVQELPNKMMEFLRKEKLNYKEKESRKSSNRPKSSPLDDQITRRTERQKKRTQSFLENLKKTPSLNSAFKNSLEAQTKSTKISAGHEGLKVLWSTNMDKVNKCDEIISCYTSETEKIKSISESEKTLKELELTSTQSKPSPVFVFKKPKSF